MLWMWILTKKHKNAKTKFLEAILGICLLGNIGCGSRPAQVAPIQETTPEVTATIEPSKDYSSFYDSKVIVKQDTPFYLRNEDELIEIGVIRKDTYLDIGNETYQNKLRIQDSSYYVDGEAIEESGRWFQHHNHLLGLQQEIITRNPYRMELQNGNEVITMDSEDTYEIYVLPSEEDPRYGIYFLNEIYYIPEEDIQTISNTMPIPKEAYAKDIPVLMYHFFYDDAVTKDRPDTNYVEQQEFDEQLSTLANDGYQSLTMREVLYFMQNRAFVPEKSFALTIDDGDSSVYEYGFPIIKKYDMNATLFLICAWEEPTLSWQNWQMREEGIELQSHSFDMHQGGCDIGHGGRLLCVEHDKGVEDTRMAFDYVDGGFVYCYPFGDVNEHAMEIIQEGGAKLAFTTEFGKINPTMNPLKLPRIRVIGGRDITFFMKNIKE